MSILFRMLPAAGALLAALAGASAARAEPMITVQMDQARVLKVPRPAATVIVGNPAIADVSVQDSNTMVVTGRSYGITNLIVLDGEGKTLIDQPIGVRSFEEGTVRIYRQAARETVACSPECQPTVTVGDNDMTFLQSASQFATREKMAVGDAK